MSRLTEWAMLMYPPEWRRRYGVELQGLLEDSGRHDASRQRDIFDILKGGLIVRYTGTNLRQMAVTWGLTCGFFGLLLSGWVALRTPDHYEANAKLVVAYGSQPASVEQMNAVAAYSTTDEQLSRVIKPYDLYQALVRDHLALGFGLYAKRDPSLSEKLAQFRKDLRMEARPNGILVVSYSGWAAPLTTQVANQIAANTIELNVQAFKQNPTLRSVPIKMLEPAHIPKTPAGPNRGLIFCWGFIGGPLAGIAIALLRCRPMQLAS
jgi:hypothetical protein